STNRKPDAMMGQLRSVLNDSAARQTARKLQKTATIGSAELVACSRNALEKPKPAETQSARRGEPVASLVRQNTIASDAAAAKQFSISTSEQKPWRVSAVKPRTRRRRDHARTLTG